MNFKRILSKVREKFKTSNSLILALTFIFLLLTTFILVSNQKEKQISRSHAQTSTNSLTKDIPSHHFGTKPVVPFVEDTKRGLHWDGLRSNKSGKCKDLLEVTDKTGKFTGCSHGPDPAPDGVDITTQNIAPLTTTNNTITTSSSSTTTGAIVCDPNDTSPYRVENLYVHASDVPDRPTLVNDIIQYDQEIDRRLNESAEQTGGIRHIRFVTNASCDPVVDDVVVSTTGDDNLSNTISEVQAKGFNRTDRKYLMWVDANVYCGIATAGGGKSLLDDRPDQSNSNNIGPDYARVDNGCFNDYYMAHEFMHILGAVQQTAPNSTLNMHCTDESDEMCYPDSPTVNMVLLCPDPRDEGHYDCNKSTYFSTNPPPGSYLDTHWNTANNQFLINGGIVPSSTPYPTPTPLPGLTTVQPGTYLLINVNSNKALNIAGGTADDTNVNILTRNDSAFQAWQIIQNSDGTYKLVNPNTTKALTVHQDVNDGTNVDIVTDSNNWPAQKWQFYQNSDGSYTLLNPNSIKTLNVAGGITADGTNVNIWTNNGSDAQKWKLVTYVPPPQITPGMYNLINVNSNKALDVYNAGTAVGTNVDILTSNNGASQRWLISANSDGTYKLINPNSGKALDLAKSGTVVGTNVDIYTDNGSFWQKWLISANSDGTYSLVDPQFNNKLDVSGSLTADRTSVQTYTPNGTASQKWKLIPATQVFTATADTYVISTSPGLPHGTAPTYTTLLADASPTAIPYLKFDLTSLAGRTIISASLQLKSTNDSTSGAIYVKQVYSTSWTETMTYNTRVAIGATIWGTIKPAGKTNTYMGTALTTSAIQAYTGQLVSMALANTSSDSIQFSSREATYGKPALVITYR